jgi:hypothetical protein
MLVSRMVSLILTFLPKTLQEVRGQYKNKSILSLVI